MDYDSYDCLFNRHLDHVETHGDAWNFYWSGPLKTFNPFTLFITDSMAHEGPAYPIIVDHPFLSHKLSVWADPDTFNGTFFFYLDNSTLSNSLYQVEAYPQNAPTHLLKVESLTNTLIVPFDQNLMWNVTIKVLNAKSREVLTSKVVALEVTPPGPNKTEFIIYLIPFVIVAAFWIKIAVIKRNNKRS